MSTVNGQSIAELRPSMDSPPAKMHEFVAWMVRQLSVPTKHVIHVRTSRGPLQLSRGDALRVLRVARCMVNLHKARERIRRACVPVAANDAAVPNQGQGASQ